MGIIRPKLTVDQIKEEVPGAGDSETEQAAEEYEVFAEKESLVLTNKRLALKNVDLWQDITLRREYARKISRLATGWVGFLFIVVIISGYGDFTKFSLSDSVIIALVSGSTASIIGVYLAVARYLFHINSK